MRDFVQLVSWFRIKYADRPFWLLIATLILFTLVAAALRRRPATDSGTGGPNARTVWLGIAAIVIYVAIVVWYFVLESFFDHAEPTVAALAWLFEVGKPIYHAPDAAERYSHMYGPLSFMIPAWFLAWLGPGVLQAKAAGITAGLLSVTVMYRLVRSATAARNAVVLTGLFAIQALMFRNLAFWIRPDSFQLLFVAVGLLGASATRPVLAALVLGISTGVLVNLKLTGVLYALPAVGLLAANHGLSWIVPAGLVGSALAVLPFLVFDNISFGHFSYWVQVSAGNGIGFWTLRQNVEWALFLLVPVVPSLLAESDAPLSRARRGFVLAGLALGITGVVIAASKPGAGPYHLMPFLPVVGYVTALYLDAIPRRVRRQRAFAYACPAFAVTAVLIAMCQQVFFIAGSTETLGLHTNSDLRRFAAAHPTERIGMGYTAVGERLTYARPLLVFRDGFYLLDAPAIQELQMSGLELPQATLEALADCRAGFWLFPKGSEPFTAPNKYPSARGRLLFPENFRRTFFDHYERATDTEYFQVWRCRRTVAAAR